MKKVFRTTKDQVSSALGLQNLAFDRGKSNYFAEERQARDCGRGQESCRIRLEAFHMEVTTRTGTSGRGVLSNCAAIVLD